MMIMILYVNRMIFEVMNMALVVHNPFGQDAADFNEETSADRIGRRIGCVKIFV
jgi:hypothetical protein